MYTKAGLDGQFTIYFLRATAVEQLICEKTGHRSEAVEKFKHKSDIQRLETIDVIKGLKRNRESVEKSEECDSKHKLKLKLKKK